MDAGLMEGERKRENKGGRKEQRPERKVEMNAAIQEEHEKDYYYSFTRILHPLRLP